MRPSLFLLLAVVSAFAIERPKIGFVTDPQGHVHPVDGLAGAFVTGDPVATADGFATDGSISIRRTSRQLEAWNAAGAVIATYEAGPGQALLAADQGTAVAYLKSTGVLWTITLDGGASQTSPRLPLAAGDHVVAIGTEGRFAVRRGDGSLSVLKMSGNDLLESRLIEPADHVLFRSGGMLVTSAGSTVRVQRADGSWWTADLQAEVKSLRGMGANWIHAGAGLKDFALLLKPGAGDPVLYQLPRFTEDR